LVNISKAIKQDQRKFCEAREVSFFSVLKQIMEIFDSKQYILMDSQEYSTKIDNLIDRPDFSIEGG
jgi:hypothetical protein